MRKFAFGGVVVVLALLVAVIGFIYLPNRAPLQQETVTPSMQQSVVTSLQSISATQESMIPGLDVILPIVDRNGFTGRNLSLSQFQSRVIVLEFMAPWCPPCQSAASIMEATYEQYSAQGVVFLVVEVPWKPDLSHYKNVTMTQFLTEHPSKLTYVYDSSGTLSSIYNVQSVPAVFVLSKNGTIQASYSGLDGVSSFASGVSINEALGNLPVSYGQWADPVGDTFDSQGHPAVADKYIDITGVAFGELGSTYIFNITMAGALPPASSSSSSIFVEWDVLLDLDRSNATHPWGLYNGIGVDAIARATWWRNNSGYAGQLMTWPGGGKGGTTFQTIGYNVKGATVTIYVVASMIGNPNRFDFVVRVAKFAEPGDRFIVGDKAPNQGNFTFANGSAIAPTGDVVVTWNPAGASDKPIFSMMRFASRAAHSRI
jgi:thiol-disulfide isomerase/thioredoxin